MTFKTVLLIVHILGVVLGVGGVLMLDAHLLRHLRGARILAQDVKLTWFISLFVKAGLITVWVSGLVIIAIAPDGPAAVLANPKLQAKLVVVVVLTINALFVETLALPLMHGNVGKPLFHGVDQIRRSVILGCAAISTLSWLYPIALGVARELNGVVPAQFILTDYALLLAGLATGMQVAGRVLYRPSLDDASLRHTKRSSREDAAGTARDPSASVRRLWGDQTTDAQGTKIEIPTPDRRVEEARRAGRQAILASIAPERVMRDFAAFGSDEERREFRTGLFEALRARAGGSLDADSVFEVVAADEALGRKFAAVAPHQMAREAFTSAIEQTRRRCEEKVWAAVKEWRDTMVALNASAGRCETDREAAPNVMTR